MKPNPILLAAGPAGVSTRCVLAPAASVRPVSSSHGVLAHAASGPSGMIPSNPPVVSLSNPPPLPPAAEPAAVLPPDDPLSALGHLAAIRHHLACLEALLTS